MGIIRNNTENNCNIAIWNTQETLVELLKLSKPFDLTKRKNEKRKKEFLSSANSAAETVKGIKPNSRHIRSKWVIFFVLVG